MTLPGYLEIVLISSAFVEQLVEQPAAFEASVAIWKGVKPIANGSWVMVAAGQIRLFDGKGRLMGEGPRLTTYAKPRRMTMGIGMSVWIGGEKYMLSPGSGNRPEGVVVSLHNPGVGAGAAAVAHGQSFAMEFYAALEKAGGNLGSPPER